MNPARFPRIVAQAQADDIPVVPAALEGKHPGITWRELQGRLPTPQEYSDWSRWYKHRNGLYILGPISGRCLIDPDTIEANEYLAKRITVETQSVQTARGLHYHFAYPEQFHVHNSASKLYEGIDVRGRGGVSVAVGSIHRTGFTYRWLEGHSPQDVPLAPLPNFIREWLEAEARRRASASAGAAEARPFTGRVGAWARKAIDSELEGRGDHRGCPESCARGSLFQTRTASGRGRGRRE
jgi:bifunctional DNA primase/polymerase-like protein